jgi:pyruvate dehydrogenase E2 component (dihydrolipoamide acetyltransferase)
VGDQVQINDIVVEIETAKSLVELPSPYAGVVTALLVSEGETVEVGTPIIAIGEPSEAPAAPAKPPSDEIDLSNPAASGGGEGESLVGRMKADRGSVRRPRRKATDVAGVRTARADLHDVFNSGVPHQHEKVERIVSAILTDAEEQRGAAGMSAPATPAPRDDARSRDPRPLAKPPVRKLAKDLGVDLAALAGSGTGGTITRADVVAAAGSAAMPQRYDDLARPGVAPMTGAREVREPIKGVRKMMAQAMTSSAFTAPHVTEWVTLDITASMELCARLRSRREFAELKISPLLILARACILAMRRTPVINSFWDEAAQEVVLKGYVNLGIAAATPRGLVVPNVKDADAMSLVELATAFGELTATAREGKTQPADMAGGTFTITNVGVFGVDAGTPIINPGESAILCFGAAKRQPWVVVRDGVESLEIRDVCTLALSFDHRHIDGESGSRFLADVAGIMSDPATSLLF